MAILVMKFGGTSVADLDCIRNAAQKVKREVDAGWQVAVIVSAMSGETNKLVGFVRSVSALYDAREYDAVVASGEQVTSGLMALTLQSLGVNARSWQGWQMPLRTNASHGAARIEEIDTTAMLTKFADGFDVAVCAGFQGVSPDNRIATLGRGGSDTSAVALAAALEADRCDIYTDVDGVYTTDPRVEPDARKIDRIAFEEMLELASQGAKVLQTRSVELAMRYKVPLQVRSSFSDAPGTIVCDEEEIVESNVVTGVAFSRDEAKITLQNVADRPGVAAAIFGPLAEANVNVDMIVQNTSTEGTTDISFTMPMADLSQSESIVQRVADEIGATSVTHDDDIAKVSLVGAGMKSSPGIAAKMFRVLADHDVNIQMISTSTIRVSIIIPSGQMELAARALHTAFGLDSAADYSAPLPERQ